nr:hypothetical protein [Rhodovulum visakhapatnamense]
MFETTVARCIEEGLVSGKRMAVDASLIEADANKQNSTPKEDWDVSQIDPAERRVSGAGLGKSNFQGAAPPQPARGTRPGWTTRLWAEGRSRSAAMAPVSGVSRQSDLHASLMGPLA